MKLEFERFELRMADRWTLARTTGANTAIVVIVQLIDRDQICGLGEAAPVARYHESAKSVEDFLRRIDPAKLSFSDVTGAMQYVNALSSGDMSAKCAVSAALFDGAGKRARKPVHDLLGLEFHEGRHLTSFTIGIDSPATIHRKVEAAASFRIIKMKVGGADDERCLKTLREVAPTKQLRLDANEGWKSKELSLERIEFFARDGRIDFVEQPMPASTRIEDWIWLKKRSPLPLFADESYHVANDLDKIMEGFDGVNVKLVKAGGIEAAATALRAARNAGLKTMLGCMIETSILISAGAHLAELCDYLDLDGNLLVTNDPYEGVTASNGMLSFAGAREVSGLRVAPRSSVA